MVIDYLKVKTFMDQKNIKQKQLAQKMGWLPYRVSQLLNGKNNPKIETLQKLAKALDVDLNFLLKQPRKISILHDFRIKKLVRDFGTEGLGFFVLIEQQLKQNPMTINDIKVLVPSVHYKEFVLKAVVNDYELFNIDENDFISLNR